MFHNELLGRAYARNPTIIAHTRFWGERTDVGANTTMSLWVLSCAHIPSAKH